MATLVKANSAGIRALLKEPGVLDDLEARAERVRAAAGDGYETSSRVGATRARASVGTATYQARRDNAANHTLLGALDAAR